MNPTARALLAHASNPDAADTVLFARLIGARIDHGDVPLLGLTRAELRGLAARHFPHASIRLDDAPIAPADTPHHAFVHDLHALLMWHDRTVFAHPEDAHGLASIIAAASLRPDHLWRDLGLDGREDVTDMLTRHYPELIVRNVENLRWKKFLAQQVAHANGVAPMCAPGCPGCEDFSFCYPRVAAPS